MKSLFDILNTPKVKEKDARLLVFEIYCSDQDKKLRKIENWKRYIIYLKSIRKPDNIENRNKFKKATKIEKPFIKELNIREFCILTSHIPKDDWFYNLSIARDRYNRKESVGAWLFGSIYKKDLQNYDNIVHYT